MENYFAKGTDLSKLRKAVMNWQEKQQTERSTEENWTFDYEDEPCNNSVHGGDIDMN